MSQLLWHGDQVYDDAVEAMKLGGVRWGITVISQALPLTPVRTGTLRRSLHCASEGVDHSQDFPMAKGGHDLAATMSDRGLASEASGNTGLIVICEVGSWLRYALVQERRKHYLSQPIAALAGEIGRFVAAAYDEVRRT